MREWNILYHCLKNEVHKYNDNSIWINHLRRHPIPFKYFYPKIYFKFQCKCKYSIFYWTKIFRGVFCCDCNYWDVFTFFSIQCIFNYFLYMYVCFTKVHDRLKIQRLHEWSRKKWCVRVNNFKWNGKCHVIELNNNKNIIWIAFVYFQQLLVNKNIQYIEIYGFPCKINFYIKCRVYPYFHFVLTKLFDRFIDEISSRLINLQSFIDVASIQCSAWSVCLSLSTRMVERSQSRAFRLIPLSFCDCITFKY